MLKQTVSFDCPSPKCSRDCFLIPTRNIKTSKKHIKIIQSLHVSVSKINYSIHTIDAEYFSSTSIIILLLVIVGCSCPEGWMEKLKSALKVFALAASLFSNWMTAASGRFSSCLVPSGRYLTRHLRHLITWSSCLSCCEKNLCHITLMKK